MHRIKSWIVLMFLASCTNNAQATVLVSVVKEPQQINGLDVWDVHITGYEGADDFVGNTISGLKGTFAAADGTLMFLGNSAAEIRVNASNAGPAVGGGTSFVNFDSYAGAQARAGGPAADSMSATWFTNDRSVRLRPVDESVGPNDDGFDQTLLAQVFVSPGGGFRFLGQTNGFGGALSQPLHFGTDNVDLDFDPIALAFAPSPGTPLTVGDTITVANAAAVAPHARQTAQLAQFEIGPTGGSGGKFTAPGLGFRLLPAGASITSTIAFDGAGLLNGYRATGHARVIISPFETDEPATHGDYPLSATVSGNVGNGTAPIAPGRAYAGLSSTSGLTDSGPLVHLPSTATLFEGTNNTSDKVTVGMAWSLRTVSEQSTPAPLLAPASDLALTSDKVELTGIDSHTFVLQMTYDWAEAGESEATYAAHGGLYLASFDAMSQVWFNAIDLNHGQNVGATNVQGAWNGQIALGTWGVDTAANTVWAVLDHNSLFASGLLTPVPEPTSIGLALCGLVVLAFFCRPKIRPQKTTV